MTFIPDPNPFVLNDNTLYLWRFSLLDDLPMDILTPDEITRAKRFYFKHHQRRFATARTKLRQILGKYLSINAKDVQFETGKHGKPSVANQQDLHFNLSHSDDYALLGIANNPLGIDIEHYAARPYLGIAKHSFSTAEVQALENTPSANLPALFFRIWSQKEAFIKASGLGLSYPVNSFTVPFAMHDKPSLIEDRLHNQTWQIQSFMYDVAISGALCCHPDIAQFYINDYEMI